MSRGQRSSSSTTNSGNSAAAATSGSQQQTPRRGNKTLGWYLGEKLQQAANNNTAESTTSTEDSTSSQMAPNRPGSGPRKGSLVDIGGNSSSSTRSSPKIADEQLVGKSHTRRNVQQQQQLTNLQRPRANSSAMASKKQMPVNTSLALSSHSGTGSNSTKDLANQLQQQTSSASEQINGGNAQKVGKGLNVKDDYWYYDEVSDGFYYEHNGTRGWRKRKPEWGTVEQMKGITETKTGTQQQRKNLLFPDPKASVPSLLAPQQLNKFMQPSIVTGVDLIPPPPPAMNIKYYDPATDGFYYEMASFDGWKRRQPTAEGVSPPNSLASSLCASQLKGQKSTQQQQRQSSSPVNSTGAIGVAPHRKIQPLHYQAYQQPAPQLNPLELQEMVLMAQQQHQQQRHHVRNTTTTIASSSCCCAPQQQHPSCCSSSAPSCCCTSIAAMAAQMVLKQQQQQHMMQMNNSNKQEQRRDNNSSFGLTDSKSTDNIRSLLDNKLLAGTGLPELLPGSKPSKLFPEQQLMKNKTQQNKLNLNLKLPQSKWTPLGIVPSSTSNLSEQQTNTTTTMATTTLSSGSFEEPYEFYWSGDEASSEAAPPFSNYRHHQMLNNALNEPFTLSSTTAASVSSVDDDGMDELMMSENIGAATLVEKPKFAPIGSEQQQLLGNFSNNSTKNMNANGKKRPDTLKLACPKPLVPGGNRADQTRTYEPISPGEILYNGVQNNENEKTMMAEEDKEGSESPAVSYLPYQFNVDKFIADLPLPSFDQERDILHSLRNPNLRTPMAPVTVAEPTTADTPLFTPGILGKDPWAYYRQKQQSAAGGNPWAYP